MSPPKRNSDPSFKVKWAKEHIRQLAVAIDRFMEPRPYEIIEEVDTKGGQPTQRVSIKAEFDPEIPCLIGDALHNLRSALDHLLYRIMPDTVVWERFHMFPIYRDANEFESRILGKRGKIEGLPDTLVQRIRDLKPYKGGNDPLWRLNELNNIDKHRLLLAVVIAHHHRRQSLFGFIDSAWDPLSWVRTETLPLEHGAVVPTPNPNVDMKDKVSVVLALNESKIIEPQPVVPLLVQLCDAVERTISIFDDVT